MIIIILIVAISVKMIVIMVLIAMITIEAIMNNGNSYSHTNNNNGNNNNSIISQDYELFSDIEKALVIKTHITRIYNHLESGRRNPDSIRKSNHRHDSQRSLIKFSSPTHLLLKRNLIITLRPQLIRANHANRQKLELSAVSAISQVQLRSYGSNASLKRSHRTQAASHRRTQHDP